MKEIIINHIDLIIIIFALSFLIAIEILTFIGFKNYHTLKERYNDLVKIKDDLKIENERLRINSSEKLFKFLQEAVMHITIIKFREYIDSHDINMVTRENIKRLASEIATDAYNYIDHNRLEELSNGTLMTTEFYTMYIVHIAINTLKKLIENEINEVVNNN